MPPQTSEPDLLTSLKSDPKVLLSVVQEIDADHDFKLAPREIAAWMVKHASALNIQGHVFAKDLESKAASALAAETLEAQHADPHGPEMTPEFMAKWAKAQADETFLTGDLQVVAEAISLALRENNLKTNAPKESPASPTNVNDKKEQREDQKLLLQGLKQQAASDQKAKDLYNEYKKQFQTQWANEDKEAKQKEALKKVEPEELKKIRKTLMQYAPSEQTPSFEDLRPLIQKQAEPAKSEGRSH